MPPRTDFQSCAPNSAVGIITWRAKSAFIVVFIGEKEHYGNTIIVQQIDGIDTWYGNVYIGDIKIYDYVQKGNLLGEVLDDKLYLVFQKEGKYLNYKDYI